MDLLPTPTGSQLLPACGIAWGIKLDGKKSLVVTTVGDAATRQGDFFEAICFAKEKKLPVLFVVEDNAYGISSYTRDTNPLALDALQPNDWRHIDGRDVQKIYDSAAQAMDKIRAGNGPVKSIAVSAKTITVETADGPLIEIRVKTVSGDITITRAPAPADSAQEVHA